METLFSVSGMGYPVRGFSGEMIEYVAVREDGTVAASPGAAFAPA